MKKSRWFITLCTVLIILTSPMWAEASSEKASPVLPRETVDLKWAETPGNVIGTASNREAFNVLLQRGMHNLDPDFIILYTGSDYQGLFRDLKEDATGKYFYGTAYHHWLVKGVNFSTRGQPGALPIHFSFEYHHTAAEENRLNEMVEKVLQQLITPEMTALEKIDAVHDYIILTSNYTWKTKRSPQSAYTLMTERGGVCQAYSTLGYKMLDRLGFEVKIATGFTNEKHAWLKVKLDGEWYNLDITYDDSVPDRKREVQYRYSLLSDTKLSKTHRPTAGILLPASISTKYDGRNDGKTKTYSEEALQRYLQWGMTEP